MRENRTLTWISDNPMTFMAILLAVISGIALVIGYREGFLMIMGALLPWVKGGDAETKLKVEESRRHTDLQFAMVHEAANGIKEQQVQHDLEVESDVWSAKADCEGMDVEMLIECGNSMLREHGVLRSEAD